VNLNDLIRLRWSQACQAVGLQAPLRWKVADGYPHFKKKRGYAVCFHHNDGSVSMQFATKTCRAPFHRADALVRHEIGHALDFYLPSPELDRRVAYFYGVQLPQTPERRADALAHLIWGEPLRYDRELVQSTRFGTYPRPEHLGL
jgi:hypothetical protein